MPLNWIDVSDLSFNALLLLEREQLGWLPSWNWKPAESLAIALRANPCVAWYLAHKNPEIAPWVNELLALESELAGEVEQVRQAEIDVLQRLDDLITYAVEPERYDAQPFTRWDDVELTSIVSFDDKWVLDVGAGTGRLAFVAAPNAAALWAVEPVENLRRFMREKAAAQSYDNFYAVDGLITRIPFPDQFADVAMGGHVFGDYPEEEIAEMERVTRPGGMVVFMPATNAEGDDEKHRLLLAHDYEWAEFEEPEEGMKRKYWKRLGGH